MTAPIDVSKLKQGKLGCGILRREGIAQGVAVTITDTNGQGMMTPILSREDFDAAIRQMIEARNRAWDGQN